MFFTFFNKWYGANDEASGGCVNVILLGIVLFIAKGVFASPINAFLKWVEASSYESVIGWFLNLVFVALLIYVFRRGIRADEREREAPWIRFKTSYPKFIAYWGENAFRDATSARQIVTWVQTAKADEILPLISSEAAAKSV